MKRRKMTRQHSKRDFKRKSGVHPKNNPLAKTMRGGIRL